MYVGVSLKFRQNIVFVHSTLAAEKKYQLIETHTAEICFKFIMNDLTEFIKYVYDRIFITSTCRREMTRDDEGFLKNFFASVMGVIIIRSV